MTRFNDQDLLQSLAIVGGQMLSIIQKGRKLDKNSDEIIHAIEYQCLGLIEGHEDIVQEYFKGD
jgi:hypothetical protein